MNDSSFAPTESIPQRGRKMRVFTQILIILSLGIFILAPFILSFSSDYQSIVISEIACAGSEFVFFVSLVILFIRSCSKDIRIAITLMMCMSLIGIINCISVAGIHSDFHAGEYSPTSISSTINDIVGFLNFFLPLIYFYAFSLIGKNERNTDKGRMMAILLSLLSIETIFNRISFIYHSPLMLGSYDTVLPYSAFSIYFVWIIVRGVINIIAWCSLINTPLFFETYDNSSLSKDWWNPLNKLFLGPVIAVAILCLISLIFFKFIAPAL